MFHNFYFSTCVEVNIIHTSYTCRFEYETNVMNDLKHAIVEVSLTKPINFSKEIRDNSM